MTKFIAKMGDLAVTKGVYRNSDKVMGISSDKGIYRNSDKVMGFSSDKVTGQ